MVSIPRGSLLAVSALGAGAPSDGLTIRIPHDGGGLWWPTPSPPEPHSRSAWSAVLGTCSRLSTAGTDATAN